MTKRKSVNQNAVNPAGFNRHPKRNPAPPPRPVADTREEIQALAQALHLLWPWKLHEYPGWTICAAAAIGCQPDTIRRYMVSNPKPLSPPIARAVVTLLRSRAAQEIQIAQRLETYVARRDEETAANIRSTRPARLRALREEQGYRSAPAASRKPR